MPLPPLPEPPSQMFRVPDAEVARILALTVPAHPHAHFDDAAFLDLVARSISVTEEEKREMVAKADRFSRHQADELFRILTDERVKFAELIAKHAALFLEAEQIVAASSSATA